MKSVVKALFIFGLILPRLAVAQNARVVSECTIVYNLSLEDGSASPQMVQSLNGATKVVYIKGAKSRSDLISSNYSFTILNNNKTDTSVILREIGNAKYISYLDANKRLEKNKRFEGVTFTTSNEKKTILGYECLKAVAKLSDGTLYNVFYTPLLIPSNKEYEYQFRNLPGLALEYETGSEDGKTTYKFTATKINLMPVKAAMFDIPTSGYRIL